MEIEKSHSLMEILFTKDGKEQLNNKQYLKTRKTDHSCSGEPWSGYSLSSARDDDLFAVQTAP